jgi:hypothetical protein
MHLPLQIVRPETQRLSQGWSSPMHWSWHLRPESQLKSQDVPLQVGLAPLGAVQRTQDVGPHESMLMLLLHCLSHS